MNTVWTSLGSIIFGLIGLFAPCIIWVHKDTLSQKIITSLFITSLSACGISICIQTFYAKIMVEMQDWVGLIDTMGGIAFISRALLILTILLNIFVAISYFRKPDIK